MSEGRKDDTGKLRYDLIPAEPLAKVAHVYTMGAAKYDDRNWEKGLKWGRVFAAMMRHLWAWWKGESIDKEGGQHHLASVAWGALALMEYERTHPELDDRPLSREAALEACRVEFERQKAMMKDAVMGIPSRERLFCETHNVEVRPGEMVGIRCRVRPHKIPSLFGDIVKWEPIKPQPMNFVGEIVAELQRARKEHPINFHSYHEGLEILREEFEELVDEVRLKPSKRDKEAIRKEATQVGAMALRFLEDLYK